MSSAPIFITFGRSISFGMEFMARSIFSFTSMKIRDMSLPGSKDRVIVPPSIREMDSMSFKPATCESCWRMGVTMRCSISLAEEPGDDICTVMRGMSMSVMRETGILPRERMPRVTMAMSAIVTAIGRWRMFRIIVPF